MKKSEKIVAPRTKTHGGTRVALWVLLALGLINAAYFAVIVGVGALNALKAL